jgi:hypothetical protein
MKLKTASPEYIEKAMALSKEDAERLFARMRGKLARRLENERLQSVEAVALQLQLEDEELQDWRKMWAEIVDRANKPAKKGTGN